MNKTLNRPTAAALMTQSAQSRRSSSSSICGTRTINKGRRCGVAAASLASPWRRRRRPSVSASPADGTSWRRRCRCCCRCCRRCCCCCCCCWPDRRRRSTPTSSTAPAATAPSTPATCWPIRSWRPPTRADPTTAGSWSVRHFSFCCCCCCCRCCCSLHSIGSFLFGHRRSLVSRPSSLQFLLLSIPFFTIASLVDLFCFVLVFFHLIFSGRSIAVSLRKFLVRNRRSLVFMSFFLRGNNDPIWMWPFFFAFEDIDSFRFSFQLDSATVDEIDRTATLL